MARPSESHEEKAGKRADRPPAPSNPRGNAPGRPHVLAQAAPMANWPRQPYRPAQPNIPNDKGQRDRLRSVAREHVQHASLVPPLTADELRHEAEQVCTLAGVERVYRDFAAILVNNEAWRDTVAGIPYARRLLLLPQCLRAAGRCPAPIDELGLVCQECGSCVICHLQREAERLGYAVLVAEGATFVTKLIEAGQIEAIVGVSCMSVLEKCFPHMEARAVPGVAIPLLQDGCASTSVDLDWVWEAIHLVSENVAHRLDLDAIKRDVQGWFSGETLDGLIGVPAGETETIARDWLARGGKRWRPYLTTCVYLSLQGDAAGSPVVPTDDLKRLAIAVECFHKASLIHDDIEDGDDQRYGQDTLHVAHGTPVALNVGDFLLGEGYRLIAELDVHDPLKVAMLRTAAAGHLTLSRGQGAELWWARQPGPLSALEVLEIFRQKTAPAFEVALRLGACYGGAEPGVHAALTEYSAALGVAYQIRDDLEDFAVPNQRGDLRDPRLSVVLAVAHTRASGAARELTGAVWSHTHGYDEMAADVDRLIAELGVLRTVEDLLDTYIARATRSLHPLRHPTLKALLRRVIGRIFGDEQIRGYCREFEARHAGGRALGPEPAA